jgi:hypothetical protein
MNSASAIYTFKKAHDLGRRKILFNILIHFGIPMILLRLINICLNETYSRYGVGKHSSDTFPIENGLKDGNAM